MKRISPEWLGDPATQAVCRALETGGARALLVGGCVRNALLGEPDSDIDIATDARPEKVVELAEASGLRAVPTGLDHGTITVVADGTGFEVTTFRRDVETDGRRAVVAFSTDIAEDAARRDFTMNALYATRNGDVLDPLGGIADLTARRLRFIGDAETRIREDYLRALRFFRFHAWYADRSNGFDPDALAAIAETLDGLTTLSRERVGAEMIKLLSAPNPAPELSVMAQIGVLTALLPGSDPRAIGPLVHFEGEFGMEPEPVRRLSSLGGAELAPELRLSKGQAKRLDQLRKAATSPDGPQAVGFHFPDVAQDALILRGALLEQPVTQSDLDDARFGAAQRFPIAARDLMDQYTGKALGDRLQMLKAFWVQSGFQATKQELLDLPDTES